MVEKKDPGVQCTDFILWAVNRRVNGDSTWLDRINTKMRFEAESEGGRVGGVDLDLGTGLSEPPCYYSAGDYPADADSQISKETSVKIYLHAESMVSRSASGGFPDVASHLRQQCEELTANRLTAGKRDYVIDLAAAYLKLFDMVPLIGPVTPGQERTFLLLSKRHLALIMRDDRINGVRTRQWMLTVRDKMITEHPERLSF